MKTIILIHGLFMNNLSMRYLDVNFRSHGFNIVHFEYNTVKFNKEETIRKLNDLINKLDSKEITLIGHSMGGLVSRIYQSEYKNKKVNKIITLGTPHNGSHIAKYLIKTKLRPILGTCGDSGIIIELPKWEKENCPIGCIMGIADFGVNTIFSRIHGKNGLSDGNVFLDEAKLENSTDEVILKNTHMGMLFSKNIVLQCLSFIDNNVFIK